MIILSGGTGTPKLIRGFMDIVSEEKISVVVNTAEDIFVSGTLVTPDIDTVLYLLSGLLDEKKWWGVSNDTFKTYEMLKSLGIYETLPLSEIDRAVCIARTDLINSGKTLTETTEIIADKLKIKSSVFPMTDSPVQTIITTKDDEVMHFQKFWIQNGGKPEVKSVDIEFSKNVHISEELKSEFERNESVIIGPSNPISSI
ncbi:MAG: hypothetical protein GX362_01715 [Methanosarcinaceae archaeon]|nr:hypothetical protein [Methanosarcinaceae archaeon]